MTSLRVTLALVVVLVAVLLAAGCTGSYDVAQNSSTQNDASNKILTRSPVATDNIPKVLETPAPVFFREPVIIPQKFQSNVPFGSFEDHLITSSCANVSQTIETNYIFISGSGKPMAVKYILGSDDNLGNFSEKLPPNILNASISPNEFTSDPNLIYVSHVNVTIGPNVGKWGKTGNSVWQSNPKFSLHLKASVDGINVTDLDDQLTITKECYIFPQARQMQSIPDLDTRELGSGTSIHPGEKKIINLPFWNFDGKIRLYHFKIAVTQEGLNFTDPLGTGTYQEGYVWLDGVNISFSPQTVIGRTFQSYSDTMLISARKDAPVDEYSVPLDICFQGLDINNTHSDNFPFSEDIDCRHEGWFTISVNKKGT
mgnify:CR=1 FL=1